MNVKKIRSKKIVKNFFFNFQNYLFSMSKKKLLSLVIIFTILMNPVYGTAWTHGNPAGKTYINYISEYANSNYGTRDWFADQVVYLIGFNQYTYFDHWLSIYRDFYLFGTELVTSNYITYKNQININDTIITRHKTDKDLYTYFSSDEFLSFDAEIKMNEIHNNLINSINNCKFDVAAIYLGMFISLFCKSTHFPSFKVNDSLIYQKYDNVFIDDNIELDIYQKTKTKFFNSDIKEKTCDISWKEAYKISACHVYFGNRSSSNPISSNYLFNNFINACISTTDWNNITSEQSINYYTQIKENFYVAVYHCSCAILTTFYNLNLTLPYKLPIPNVKFITFENNKQALIIAGIVIGTIIIGLVLIKYVDNRETYSYYYKEKKRLRKQQRIRKKEYKTKAREYTHGHRLD